MMFLHPLTENSANDEAGDKTVQGGI